MNRAEQWTPEDDEHVAAQVRAQRIEAVLQAALGDGVTVRAVTVPRVHLRWWQPGWHLFWFELAAFVGMWNLMYTGPWDRVAGGVALFVAGFNGAVWMWRREQLRDGAA